MNLIYGIYPGSLSQKADYYRNCTELELFLTIGETNNYINFLKADFRDNNNSPYCDITPYYYALDFLVFETKRFGVEVESGTENKRVDKGNESFLGWYDKNYSQFNLLSLEERRKIIDNYNPENDVTVKYRLYGVLKSKYGENNMSKKIKVKSKDN